MFSAVQLLINRLEAYGFPVHRYHADRAQELKSRALVNWLKDRGIHGTWTPGDTPAGNRAELAVQQLKGLARKLLFTSKLEPSYWPLAVLHASNRNWSVLCESLGIPQPILLPFGLKMQARQRTKSGFQSHWRERTVTGIHVGQALDTPGGHLLLVDGDSDAKVLLTNTVYPVLPEALRGKRPRFRIRGKLSPDLAFRHVAAAVFTAAPPGVQTAPLARLLPGGECAGLGGIGSFAGMAGEVFCTKEQVVEGEGRQSEQVRGLGLGNEVHTDRAPKLQVSVALGNELQIGSALGQQVGVVYRNEIQTGSVPGQQVGVALGYEQQTGSAPGQQVSVALGNELQTDGAPIRGERLATFVTRDDGFQQEGPAGEGKGLSNRLWTPLSRGEVALEGRQADFSLRECMGVVEGWVDKALESRGNFDSREGQVMFGLVPGSEGSEIVDCCMDPWFIRYLNGVVGQNCGSFVWTTLVLSRNLAICGPNLEQVDERFPCCVFGSSLKMEAARWSENCPAAR